MASTAVYTTLRNDTAAIAARSRRWAARGAYTQRLRAGLGDAMDLVISRSADLDDLDAFIPGLLEVRAYLATALRSVTRPKSHYVPGSPTLRLERLVVAWV